MASKELIVIGVVFALLIAARVALRSSAQRKRRLAPPDRKDT